MWPGLQKGGLTAFSIARTWHPVVNMISPLNLVPLHHIIYLWLGKTLGVMIVQTEGTSLQTVDHVFGIVKLKLLFVGGRKGKGLFLPSHTKETGV